MMHAEEARTYAVNRRFQTLRRGAKAVVDAAPTLSLGLGYLIFKTTHSRVLSKYRSKRADLVERIGRDGFVVLPNHYSDDYCRECITDLDSVIASDSPHVQRHNDLRIFGAEVLSARVSDFHSERWIQEISDDYSCTKTANVFTLGSRVTPEIWNASPTPPGWHRDLRYRQFKAFLYLNTVTPENGPIQFIRGSHRMPQYLYDVRTGQLPFTSTTFTDEQVERVIRRDRSRLTTITGGPGTLILADVGMIHRGCPPRSGVRYALTNYYFERQYIRPKHIYPFNPVNPAKSLALAENW